MSIWTISIDNDSTLAFRRKEYDKGWLDLLEKMKAGQSLEADWLSLSFVLDTSRDDTGKPVPDLIQGVVTKAISENAKSIIDPFISDQVEYLPVETPLGPYFELNVKHVGCLNVEKSVVKRFKSSDNIMRVLKYSFRWEELKGKHIFLLPELGLTKLFISNELKEVIESRDLKGFLFREVPLVV